MFGDVVSVVLLDSELGEFCSNDFAIRLSGSPDSKVFPSETLLPSIFFVEHAQELLSLLTPRGCSTGSPEH
mgnify:CR=1 FL=1